MAARTRLGLGGYAVARGPFSAKAPGVLPPLVLAVTDLADGGGFLATVAGGAPGAANELYAAAVVAAGTRPAVFALVGIRTGPGAVGGTLPVGYRWWFVRSGAGGPPIAVPALSVADLADGGGFTAALSGGDPAATNTLYAAPPGGAFAAVGSRVGPGTVGGVLWRSYFWWFVRSALGAEEMVSSVVYQNLTDGLDALEQRVVDAVEAGVVGLALPGLARVYSREIPLFENIEFPCCVVTGWRLQETARGGTNASDDWGFPVSVEFLERTVDELNKRRLQLWRETVRRWFASRKLAGVPEVGTCEVEHGPLVDYQAGDDGKFLCKGSQMTLRFVARQTRL